MLKKYRTGELLNYLGVSRDTLRFYEEKGLLSPKKNDDNNYRNYDMLDVYKIMSIDFYKKRGMSIHQIQDLQKKSTVQDIQSLLEKKKKELEKMIYDWQCMVQRIEVTQEFSRDLISNLKVFSVKPMPLYRIIGEVSDFIAVEEYETVINMKNSNDSNDLLSQIVRYISFNNDSVTGTKILVVEAANAANEANDKNQYIQYPKCLYTVEEEIQPPDEPVNLIEEMYQISKEYAKLHGLRLLGEAFVMIRLITYKDNTSKTYMEIFIPFE